MMGLAYAAYNLIYSLSAYPAGILSDRIGRRPMIVAGFAWFAAVYLGFGAARSGWQLWGLLAVYGLYKGLTDGLARALAADLSVPHARGTAIGWVQLVLGSGALVASLVAGILWTSVGPAAPFFYGAALAAVAAACLSATRLPAGTSLAAVNASSEMRA